MTPIRYFTARELARKHMSGVLFGVVFGAGIIILIWFFAEAL